MQVNIIDLKWPIQHFHLIIKVSIIRNTAFCFYGKGLPMDMRNDSGTTAVKNNSETENKYNKKFTRNDETTETIYAKGRRIVNPTKNKGKIELHRLFPNADHYKF